MKVVINSKSQFYERDSDSRVVSTVVLSPSPHPQNAPEWIAKTQLFELMIKDGSLIVLDSKPTVKPLKRR